jgi:hypothetical protein
VNKLLLAITAYYRVVTVVDSIILEVKFEGVVNSAQILSRLHIRFVFGEVASFHSSDVTFLCRPKVLIAIIAGHRCSINNGIAPPFTRHDSLKFLDLMVAVVD